MIVHSDTVVRRHKISFKSYWRRKSQQGKRGRPSLDPDIKSLVLKMAKANHLWGAPKIHGELRTHLGLNKETPLKRSISNKSLPTARVLELPRLGGLHHRYEWGEAA